MEKKINTVKLEEKILAEKIDEGCEALNVLTNDWTLDYAPLVFVLYFSDKEWLLDKINDLIKEDN